MFDAEGITADFQWTEGVDHNSQFAGFFLADTFLYCAWMWPVRNADRMKGNHASRDMFSAHKVAVYVI